MKYISKSASDLYFVTPSSIKCNIFINMYQHCKGEKSQGLGFSRNNSNITENTNTLESSWRNKQNNQTSNSEEPLVGYVN